jgi:hypothetical protein
LIAPTDSIDIIERILKSYRHDDILDKDPDPICALMDIHCILAHSENGLDECEAMHLSDKEQQKGK